MAPGLAILLFLERCGGGALCTRASCSLLFFGGGARASASRVEQVPVNRRVGNGPNAIAVVLKKCLHACAGRALLEGDAWPAESGWRQETSPPKLPESRGGSSGCGARAVVGEKPELAAVRH